LPDDAHPFEELRKLALLVRYLVARIKMPDRAERGITVPKLFELVAPLEFRFTVQDLGKLSRAELVTLEAADRDKILGKLHALISSEKYGVTKPTPDELERYANDLAYTFRRSLPFSLIQGNKLGANGDVLSGIWRLFFIPTLGDPKRDHGTPAEIRGFVAIVRDPKDAAAISAETIIISQHKHWIGHVFLNGSYAYWVCTDPAKSETAFFLSNRPDDNESSIIGIGTSLQRKEAGDHRPRPIESFCFFGAKWRNFPEISDVDGLLRPIQVGNLNEMNDAIAKIQTAFCNETYAEINGLEEHYKMLHDYLGRIRVNGKLGFDFPGLHIAWN